MHLLSLRQLSHNTCRSWVCVFCCELAKRSTNRSEISVFKQHVSPAYDLNNVRFLNGIYTTYSWNLYRRTCWDFSCWFLSSAKLTQCICKAQRNGRTCGCFIRKTVTFDHVQSQAWIVTTWRRQRINTKPRTERIYINCGIIFNHGKYYSLRN